MAKLLLHPPRRASSASSSSSAAAAALQHHRPALHSLPRKMAMARWARLLFHAALCASALLLGFRLAGSFSSSLMHLPSSSPPPPPPPPPPPLNAIAEDSGDDDDAVLLKFPYISKSKGSSSRSSPGRKGQSVVAESGHGKIPNHGRGGIDAEDVGNGHGAKKSSEVRHSRMRGSKKGLKSTRVHVGRHEILIRPHPHPDPAEMIKAHKLLGIVQSRQRFLPRPGESESESESGSGSGSESESESGSESSRRNLLVVTPTFSRTFQALHLMSLIHTLRNVPRPLTWIVIEAGGASDETHSLLMDSRLPFHHLGFVDAAILPAFWSDRGSWAARLRAEALSFVRRERLEGIVVFVDDSNTHSLEFFAEARRTEWFGAFSIGLLRHSGAGAGNEEEEDDDDDDGNDDHENVDEKEYRAHTLPVQGPKCDSSCRLMDWYTPRKAKEMSDVRAGGGILEWAGFAFNAKLLWEGEGAPRGLRSWDEILIDRGSSSPSIESPLQFVSSAKAMSVIEPLGNCGHDILLWWLQVEARPDSKFPPKWVIYPRLEIVVPSKRTPWPDFLPPPPPPPPRKNHGSSDAGRRNKGKVKRREKRGSLADPRSDSKV